MRKAKTRTTTKAKTKAKATRKKATPRKAPAEHTINPGGVIDLESRLLEKGNARAIAKSLKRAAETGPRKNNPFHSALAALNAMISHLEMQKARLEAAKKELRALYGEGEDNNGDAEQQEPHPPQEFGRERNRQKSAREQRRRNQDNRPRSRPAKIV